MSAAKQLKEISENQRALEQDLEAATQRAEHFRDLQRRAQKSGQISYHDPLQQAELALKGAKSRLKHYRSVDHEAIEAEVARLRASATSETVRADCAPIRKLMERATALRLEIFIARQRLEHETVNVLRTAERLEADLLGRPMRPDFHKQSGILSPLNSLGDLRRDEVFAMLNRLADHPDDSELSKSLSRDARGQLLIAGRDARAAIESVIL